MPTQVNDDSNRQFQKSGPGVKMTAPARTEGGVDVGVGPSSLHRRRRRRICLVSLARSHGDSVVAPALTVLGAGKEFESAFRGVE